MSENHVLLTRVRILLVSQNVDLILTLTLVLVKQLQFPNPKPNSYIPSPLSWKLTMHGNKLPPPMSLGYNKTPLLNLNCNLNSNVIVSTAD